MEVTSIAKAYRDINLAILELYQQANEFKHPVQLYPLMLEKILALTDSRNGSMIYWETPAPFPQAPLSRAKMFSSSAHTAEQLKQVANALHKIKPSQLWYANREESLFILPFYAQQKILGILVLFEGLDTDTITLLAPLWLSIQQLINHLWKAVETPSIQVKSNLSQGHIFSPSPISDETDEHFYAIFQQAPFAKLLTSIHGELLAVNHRFCELVGYTQAELFQRGLVNITFPEDQTKAHAASNQLLNEPNKCIQFEKRYIHQNGSLITVQVYAATLRDAQGQPNSLIFYIQDITKQEQSSDDNKHPSTFPSLPFAQLYPLKVLLAEHHTLQCSQLVQQLQALGYQPVIIPNSLEAFRQAEHQKFDLILIDLYMADLDALEAARHLSLQDNKSPKLIAFSEHHSSHEREQWIQAGYADCFVKPLLPEQIKMALQSWACMLHHQSTFVTGQPIRLSELITRIGYSLHILKEVIELFYEDGHRLLSLIEASLTKRDIPQLKKALHEFKGICAALSASQLKTISTQIEQNLRYNIDDLDASQTQFSLLHQEFHSTHQFLLKLSTTLQQTMPATS